MAKKASATVEAPVVQKSITEQIAEFKAQEEAIKAQRLKLAEAEKEKLVAEAAEKQAAIDEADEAIGNAIWDLIGKRKDRNKLLGQCLNTVRLIPGINPAGVKDEDKVDVESLTEAIKARAELGSLPRTFGPRGPRNPERLSKTQIRIMVHLLDHGPCSRKTMGEVGTGRIGPSAQLSGRFVGNYDPATRDPMSLWGRGWVEEVDVTVDGSRKRMFQLTEAGKAKAEGLAAAQPSNGDMDGDEAE